MDRDLARRELKLKPVDVFMRKANKSGFVCPVPGCNNGTGKDGDGIRLRDGTYKCFKCGKCMDIFDLIGYTYGLTEFKDQFQKAADLYGISVD